MRKAIIPLTLILFIAAVFGLYFISQKAPEKKVEISYEEQQNDYELASQLLAAEKPGDAMKIIKKYRSEIESQSEMGTLWLDLYVQAAYANRDTDLLVTLYRFNPSILENYEEASLIIANELIANHNSEEYSQLREKWKDKAQQKAAWFLLDSDYLLIIGRREEAEEKLNSQAFEGKEDVGRLVRIALYNVDEEPMKSWKYLNQALAKDPQNPDIRSYRAQLLEHLGKKKMAHREYRALAEFYDTNLFLKDQLAEFYRREGKYYNALEVWKQALPPPSLDSIWVKTLFWSKTTRPISFNWKETPMPKGNLDPFINYLLSLKQDNFWDSEKFASVPRNKSYLRNLQETFWLRLIDALQNGKELEAMQLLEYNNYTPVSYAPNLEKALSQILHYRKFGSLQTNKEDVPENDNPSYQAKESPNILFFEQLDELAKAGEDADISPDLEKLLKSDEVFAAAFIASHWTEAGLSLHKMGVIPADFPSWVAYAIAQGIHVNRSAVEALQFASKQPPSDLITLLMAELMIADKNTQGALEKLQALNRQDTDIGFRSAYLSSLILMEGKKFDEARDIVNEQPRLKSHVSGQETLARIALLEGNNELAGQLYSKISDESTEAQSFLAKVAYNSGDWKRAKDLTQKLLVEDPDNRVLQKNLELINEKSNRGL